MKKEKNKEGFFKKELDRLKQEIKDLNKTLRTIDLRVDMLQKISKIMGLSLPLDKLLDMIMDVILSIVRVDAGSILLIDKETDELVFKVTKGEKAEEVKRFRLKMGEGIAGWVAREKKPLIVPDVTKDKRHKKEIPEAIKYETRNILCIPLLVKGEAIGVIEVINKREIPFHKEDQELLLSIANQLGVLIENALLFDELSKETKRLQTLIEVSRVVDQTLNLKELLKIIMGLIEGVMRTEASSLMLIDEETNELTFEVALGEKGEEVKKMRVPMGEGIAGWVAREKKPLNVPDVSKDPRFFKRVDDFSGFKTRNILCVPLSIKDKTIGVIEAINTLDRREFDSDDLSLFEALAQVVAVAIENARLYQDLQELFISAVKALASAIETKDP